MTQRPSADDLKRLWGLSVMPTEKVYFAQSYVDRKTGADGKPLCSAIVALVTDDPSTFSDMHRLPTDEIWHFYLGDPIELLLLHRDGRDELVVLRTERPKAGTLDRASRSQPLYPSPWRTGRR